MRDRLIKGIIFDGLARVTVIDITDIVNKEIKMHNLSPLAAAALGRAMTAGVYISANLKNKKDSFSISIKGGGEIGNIIVAGESGNFVRGYVENPIVNLPLKENGHLDVGKAVGADGFITVIKDMGLKEPYIGRTELVSGEIAQDFTKYLYVSEGVRNAVALGVKMIKDGSIGAGGVIVEALPDLKSDEKLFMLEDIMTNFTEISDIIAKKSVEEIFDFFFGHLDAKKFEVEKVNLRCSCSEQKIAGIVQGLGKAEAYGIIKEMGKIEIKCQFCNKDYIYTEQDVNKLWAE
ncbi:MAG: Hsp33 family molecular chaperone HslO [Clostridiales bacterium]|nr:Hsp33 family molecular chaperone HslO [Clostridiales bacterium]